MPVPLVIPIVFGAAAALTVGLVPVVRRLARQRGLYAAPLQNRWNRRPVPRLGGLAMAGAFFPVAFFCAGSPALRLLLLASALMFSLGLIDDVRPVRASTKFLGQMLTSALFLFLVPPVHITGAPVVDLVLSFLWLVGITNAFNLLDNIDGLAAGVAAIAGGFFVAVLVAHVSPPLTELAAVMAALTGVAAGFLIYNWEPASIFMGDGGSHLLGFLIAGATLLAAPGMGAQLVPVAAIPVVLLLVPVADTALVTFTRRLAGRSAFVGGRDHISHRLVALGISERRAVLVLYGLTVIGGLIALAFQLLTPAIGWGLTASYVVSLAAIGVYLGHIEIDRGDGAVAKPLLPTELTNRYRAYEVFFDTALIGLAYYLGLIIRFRDPFEFGRFLPNFTAMLPLVTGLHLAALWMAGKYRKVWYAMGPAEALTILQGAAIGSAASVIATLYLTRFEGYSRQAFAIAAVFVPVFIIGTRFVLHGLDDLLRRRRNLGCTALVYGAARGGALAIRELLQNSDLGLTPVGLIDDDPAKRRQRIDGLRVMGTLDDLDRLLTDAPGGISVVVVAIQALPREKFDRLCGICDTRGVEVRRLRFSLDDIDWRDRRPEVIKFPRTERR
jgi:UDP-GlcNAc:undecaprenyl-phosphate GlcNAc-1-phosphate transferase